MPKDSGAVPMPNRRADNRLRGNDGGFMHWRGTMFFVPIHCPADSLIRRLALIELIHPHNVLIILPSARAAAGPPCARHCAAPQLISKSKASTISNRTKMFRIEQRSLGIIGKGAHSIRTSVLRQTTVSRAAAQKLSRHPGGAQNRRVSTQARGSYVHPC